MPVVIAAGENTVAAQHHAGFDGLPAAEPDAAGELAQPVLRDAGHDGKTQLGVLVRGIDVVVPGKDVHAIGQQLTGKPDGVRRAAGEAQNFPGDDRIEPILRRVLDRSVEILLIFRGDAGRHLADTDGRTGPGRIFTDQTPAIRNLSARLAVGSGPFSPCPADKVKAVPRDSCCVRFIRCRILAGTGKNLRIRRFTPYGSCLILSELT